LMYDNGWNLNVQNIVKSSTVRFEQGAFFAKQCAKQHVYFTLVKCHFGPSLLQATRCSSSQPADLCPDFSTIGSNHF
jgi:hypothetical protein